MKKNKVVAVVSGGPDSIGYAAYWKHKGYEIHPLIFHYEHKGSKEVQVAQDLCKKLGFQDPIIIDFSDLKQLWKGTQLTDDQIKVEKDYAPTVVVPIRNAVFLTIAAAYAFTIQAKYVIYGAHLDDNTPIPKTLEPIYPDCSPEFQAALEAALNIGHFRAARGLQIWSPAREGLRKSENLKRTYKIIGDLIYETWSCYLSGQHHCGQCESCINRHKAFTEAGIPDGTIYKKYPGLGDWDTAVKYRGGYISAKYIEQRAKNREKP